MERKRSEELYDKAVSLLPCGVNSPVRAFLSVGAKPFYVDRAEGPYLFDVDGNRYIDFVSSWGAVILGHCDAGLTAEVQAAVEDGTSYGACHPYEPALAAMIAEAFPSIEMMRLTNSGTEATMSAVRLARGATGRTGIIKLRGCYHGHVDSLLVKAGSGLATYGVPDSEGVPADLAKHTFVAEFNDIDSVKKIVGEEKDIACLILEPVMGNMGVVLPERNFLEDVRDICSVHGIILVFDEVITGFRVARGGAQERYGVTPDLTILGKIVGGGLPLAAFGGRADVMELLAPSGPVYQAGTLSGNPLATAAGLSVLRRLRDPAVYEELEWRGARLEAGLAEFGRVRRVGAMLTLFMTETGIRNFDDVQRCDTARYGALFRHLLEHGIYVAPSQFEAMFVSLAHGDAEIDATVAAVRAFFETAD